jgi:hypothetical protein
VVKISNGQFRCYIQGRHLDSHSLLGQDDGKGRGSASGGMCGYGSETTALIGQENSLAKEVNAYE